MLDPCSLLMIGLKGPELLREEQKLIQKHRPAGLILFKRNITSYGQLKELNKELKALLSPPLLLAVDCEGGKVNRLSHLSPAEVGSDFKWPSPQEVAKQPPDKKKLLFKTMARELKALGFDINFAPVVDWPEQESQLLKTRVMGNDPPEILKNAELLIQAFLKEGLWPCLKHFPGHGGVKEDSHEELPIDSRDFKQLEPQLDIFFSLIKSYNTGIMSAHVQFPKVDPVPASFSHLFLTKILREKQGFKGLIFSDDIDMKALKAFHPGERLFLALKAGSDVVLSGQDSGSLYQILEYFEKNPEKSQALQERIRDSHKRVLAWKLAGSP